MAGMGKNQKEAVPEYYPNNTFKFATNDNKVYAPIIYISKQNVACNLPLKLNPNFQLRVFPIFLGQYGWLCGSDLAHELR